MCCSLVGSSCCAQNTHMRVHPSNAGCCPQHLLAAANQAQRGTRHLYQSARPLPDRPRGRARSATAAAAQGPPPLRGPRAPLTAATPAANTILQGSKSRLVSIAKAFRVCERGDRGDKLTT